VTLARVVLAVSGAAFLAIGLPFLVAPAWTAAHVGLSLAGALADNDVRAVYGGLQAALGAFLLASAASRSAVASGLAVQQVSFAGLALGRALSWLVAGSPGTLGIALQAAELVGLAAGALARRRLG
jgi:hypothetical protein